MDIKFSNCLSLDVLHSNYPNKRWAEMKFSDDTTLEAVKSTLFYRTGTPSHRMKLYAYHRHHENEAISLGIDDSLTLKDLGVTHHMILIIVDEEKNDVFSEETNNAQTKLFTITEEQYNNRLDNARKFISKIRAVQQNMQHTPSTVENIDHGIQSGQRCEVLSLGGVRGEILSVDQRPHFKGKWIRIKLDEPLGDKNVPGCDDGYGCYISLASWKKKILIGDYPFCDILETI
ncbi:uncharacterized protein LOC128883349 [Hylaeus volcanicus]|uniref:uncharacterized protein LOC128883349 n=1 Tax=Hylaeus volcanicus TaxID=313075 RepID=UPI0023B78CBE|nr:uncharacterized protein LOC128883349 [Hylaeus volcanicus]